MIFPVCLYSCAMDRFDDWRKSGLGSQGRRSAKKGSLEDSSPGVLNVTASQCYQYTCFSISFLHSRKKLSCYDRISLNVLWMIVVSQSKRHLNLRFGLISVASIKRFFFRPRYNSPSHLQPWINPQPTKQCPHPELCPNIWVLPIRETK